MLTYTDPDSAGFSPERLDRIRPAMSALIDRGEIAGITTLVARRGKIVHFACQGYQDVEQHRPMASDTIFRIYSMSKPVTAVATMMLFEEGAFLLDDPISRYIPELGRQMVFSEETDDGYDSVEPESPVTIRQLLTHTSGLAYGLEKNRPVERIYSEAEIMRRDETLADKIARLADLPLAHHPGTSWNYSISIDVLGRLIEVVSGLDLATYLRDRLFVPLGMTDAGFHVPPGSIDRLAHIYTPTSTGKVARVQAPYFDYSAPPPFLSGGGGLAMTAGDYARFAQMLLNGGELDGARVLGRKTVELLTAPPERDWSPVVPADWPFRDGYSMALGGRTMVNLGASGTLGSVGTYTWQGMASTDFWIDPAEELLGVTMLQALPGNFRPAQTVRTLVYHALVG